MFETPEECDFSCSNLLFEQNDAKSSGRGMLSLSNSPLEFYNLSVLVSVPGATLVGILHSYIATVILEVCLVPHHGSTLELRFLFCGSDSF